MDTILIIASFAVIVLLIFLLLKGYNATVVLTVLGCFSIFIMQYVNGASILGEEGTSGSYFFDGLGYIAEVMKTQFASAAITIIIVLGYVTMLDKINANNLFSVALANLLKGIKSRSILIALVLVLSVVVKWAVPSAITAFMLLISTVYPVLRTLGCSRATSVTSLLVCGSFPLGPNQPFTAMLFSGYIDMPEVTAPQWFLQHELKYILPTVLVAIIVFIVTSSYFDKKDIIQEDTSDIGDIKDAHEYGIPMYYALFPVIPLLLVVFLGGTFSFIPVKASVTSIYFFCLMLVLLVEGIRKKDIKEVFSLANIFMEGMGTAFTRFATIIFAGAIFAEGLAQIGGMGILMQKIIDSGAVSGTALIIAGCILALVLNALSGNFGVGFYPLATIFASMIKIGAVSSFMAYTPLSAICAMGTTLSLTSPPSLVAAEKTGIPVLKIVIRMIPTIIAAAVTLLVTCVLMYR